MSALQPSVCAKFILLIATLLVAAGVWAPQAGAQATQLLVPSSAFAVYPKQITGTMSAAQSIVITNTSDSMTVQISSLTFDVDNPEFTETDNCVGGLAPGASCTVSIIFAPTGTAGLCIQEPTLTVNDDDPGGSLDLTLFGEGAAPGGLTTTDLTSDSLSPAALAQSLVGSGVTISNVTYTGAPIAAGTFAGGQAIIGFDKGIILSDGAVSNAIGPNCDTGISTENGTPGDQDLTNLICTSPTSCASATTTNDAAVLEFDFVPQASLLTFQYTFASDEYPEFVFDFNDVFAFFLSQGEGAKKDIALIPGTNTIVSINNVNNGSTDPAQANIPPVNPQFYLDNNLQYPTVAPLNTEMDGLTTVLSVQAAVTPGQTYHIKLAIADALDDELDSNVFIKAGSLSSTSLSIVPPALGFGNQNTGTTSPSQTVTVTNSGTVALNALSVVASAGFTETNTCPTSLAVGASCTITVTFKPTASGPLNGTITISDSAPDSPQTITAGGTGNGGPFASISPFSLTFAPQAIGSVSPAQTLTVTNTGASNLVFEGFNLSNEDFLETDTCQGETIAPNATCTISVTFHPSTTDVDTGVLTLFDNAQSGGAQNVSLTGNATNSITVLPGTLGFGNQAINTASAAQTVTFTNTGSVAVTIPSVVVGTGFAETNNCTAAPIAVGAACTVMVTFTPTSAIAYSTNLTFTDSAPNSPQMVTLTGTGTSGTTVGLTVTEGGTGTGTVTSAPAGISCPAACSANFASGTAVTLTAAPTNGSTFAGWGAGPCEGTGTCTVTITAATTVVANFTAGTATNFILTVTEAGTGSGNVTSAPLGINCPDGCSGSFASGTQVTLTETPSDGSVFAGWSGACSGSETCVVTVTAATAVTATFNNSSGVVTITIPSGGSTTATTTPGGTSYYGLIITCAPGQTGTVTLTATSSSPLISVNFIPNTIVCPGGSEQAVQLQTFCQGTTVTQTGFLPGGFGFGGGIGMLLIGLMMGGVGLVSVFGRSRRVGLTFALLALVALGAGSCGGLPKSPTGQATPPGTYFISLTATLNGQTTTQPNFLTLVVK